MAKCWWNCQTTGQCGLQPNAPGILVEDKNCICAQILFVITITPHTVISLLVQCVKIGIHILLRCSGDSRWHKLTSSTERLVRYSFSRWRPIKESMPCVAPTTPSTASCNTQGSRPRTAKACDHHKQDNDTFTNPICELRYNHTLPLSLNSLHDAQSN